MWIEAALAPVARVRGARRWAPYRRASRPLPRASRTSLPGSVRTASQYLRKDDRRSRTPAQAGPGAHSGWWRRTVGTTSTSGVRFSRASAFRTAAQVLPGTGPLPRLFSTGWWIPSTTWRAHRADCFALSRKTPTSVRLAGSPRWEMTGEVDHLPTTLLRPERVNVIPTNSGPLFGRRPVLGSGPRGSRTGNSIVP